MIQSFNALFLSFQEEMKTIVETQIKVTVNGKIDKIAATLEEQNKILARLDKETKPVIEDRQTIANVARFIKWASGIAIGATALYKLIKW